MNIVEVKSPKHIQDFLDLPNLIYKDNKAYIRPLNKDIEHVFDQNKNKYFRHGTCTRWVMYKDNVCIGRVAAFVNDKYTSQYKDVGGMGFFECIEDKEAAFALFDTAKAWLTEKGMRYMDGPINFQEKDKFWGLTTTNFEQSPYYGQNYNPEYYVAFYRDYGFQTFYEQLIYYRLLKTPVQDKYLARAERLERDPKFSVQPIRKSQQKKFSEDFREIYNAAWGKREGDTFKGMSSQQALSIMKSLKPVMDERLTYFAYYDGKPIGFYISLPEVNEIFKKFNGKFGLIEKLRFLWHLKIKGVKTSFGVAFGVSPEFQGKGVEGALFKVCSANLNRGEKPVYDDVIITWIGDFNPKMIRIIEFVGGKIHQKMETLRKPFSEGEVIERHSLEKIRDTEA
tara:strand:+ start:22192 stop:23379 length:1188 start_codon:yes stop_codon:yes gene_type:complete